MCVEHFATLVTLEYFTLRTVGVGVGVRVAGGGHASDFIGDIVGCSGTRPLLAGGHPHGGHFHLSPCVSVIAAANFVASESRLIIRVFNIRINRLIVVVIITGVVAFKAYSIVRIGLVEGLDVQMRSSTITRFAIWRGWLSGN